MCPRSKKTSFIKNDRFSRVDEPIDLAFSIISTLVSHSRRKHPDVDVSGGPWHCYVSDNVLACLFPRPARPRGNKASETTSGFAALLCRSTCRYLARKRPAIVVYSSTLLWLIGNCCPLKEGKTACFRNFIVYRLSVRASVIQRM